MRISSSPRLNSLAISVVESSVMIAIALGGAVGCSKKDSTADPKFYTESANLQNADKVSSEVGAQVVLADTKDFTNEVEYNRLLGLLSKHKDLILAHRNEIAHIYVGRSGTSMSLARDRYEVSVGFNSSESDIVHLFSDRFTEYSNAEKKSTEFGRAISMTIVDTVGLYGGDVTSASDKLSQVSRGVNFTQDTGFRQLTLGSNSFAVMPNGMVINITENGDRIVSEVKMGIDARLTWAKTALPYIQQLGLDITFQPGVFDGAELQKVIVKVIASGSLVASANHSFTHVILGKRFDSDQTGGTILIDYRASDSDIVAAFRRFDTPVESVNLEPLRQDIESTFAARGFKFDRVVLDVPANTANLNALRTFRYGVVPYIQLENLRKLRVSTLHLGTDPLQYISGSGSGVNSVYMPMTASTSQVDAYLSGYILKGAFLNIDSIFQNYVYGLGISFNDAVSYGTSQAQIERYTNFAQWFMKNIDGGAITSNRIVGLRVTDDGSAASFNGGLLSIDLQNFDPAQIRIILSKPNRAN